MKEKLRFACPHCNEGVVHEFGRRSRMLIDDEPGPLRIPLECETCPGQSVLEVSATEAGLFVVLRKPIAGDPFPPWSMMGWDDREPEDV